MKDLRNFLLGFIFMGFLILPAPIASAGLFDNDEENWRRIFGEIKKINARLVSLEMGKLKAIQGVEEDLLRQVQDIKTILPDLQGSVEQGQSDLAAYVNATNKKLDQIEAQIRSEIAKSFATKMASVEKQMTSLNQHLTQQVDANEKFQTSMAGQFDALKKSLAGDMDKFAKLNQQQFQDLSKSNNESLVKVVAQLKTQTQTLDKANEIFKSELIPAIIKQNEKARQVLLAEISKSNNENNKAVVAGFSEINQKNQKLVEILEKSLKEDQESRQKIEVIFSNMGQTNDNVMRAHENIVKLKDSLIAQLDSISQVMDTLSKVQENLVTQSSTGSQKIELVNKNLMVADDKINKLAESLKGVNAQSASSAALLAAIHDKLDLLKGAGLQNDQKVDKLMGTSTQMTARTTEISQSLQNFEKSLSTLEAGLGNVDLANTKLSKLIDILKSMASEQGKLVQVLATQGEIKQSQGQVLKAQVELNKAQVQMSKAQADMSRAQVQMNQDQSGFTKHQQEIKNTQLEMNKVQAEIRKAQAEMLRVQKETKQAQAELRQAQLDMKRAQSQVLKTQAEIIRTQDEIVKTQSDIKKTQISSQKAELETKKVLSELSRKANVNISRNDAIRKTLASLAKGPASAKAP